MAEQNQAKPWSQQASVVLSFAAIFIAVFALFSVHRDQSHAKREELRDLMVKLHESTQATAGEHEGGAGGAKAWVYFDAARRLVDEIPAEVTGIDYLILANFSYAHSDLEGAEQYLDKAIDWVQKHRNRTTQALANMALAHVHFRHFPKTDLKTARQYYRKSLEHCEKLASDKKFFVKSGIHREWALDEYGAGNKEEGDEQVAAAKQLMASQSLPEKYLEKWNEELDTLVLQAKVQGGLL